MQTRLTTANNNKNSLYQFSSTGTPQMPVFFRADMKIILFGSFWVMFFYSWFVGCSIVADKGFREMEGKHTTKLLVVAWALLYLIWLLYDGQ